MSNYTYQRRNFMKVIKVGKEPEQVMRVTCEQCGAELEIAPWDLRNERISIRNVSTYIWF